MTAISSDKMSPNMFSVKRTSNWLGVARELHGGVIDVHVGKLQVGVVSGEIGDDGLAPQDGGFEHVGLIDGAHATPTGAGGDGGDFGDALDLAGFVNHGVGGLLLTVFEGYGGLGLAEVDAAGELADADDIDPVGDA